MVPSIERRWPFHMAMAAQLLDMAFTLHATKNPANDGTPRNARRFTAVPGVPTWKPPSGPVFRS